MGLSAFPPLPPPVFGPVLYNGVRYVTNGPDADNVTRMDMGCLSLIADMHKYGVRLNLGHLRNMSTSIHATMADIEFEIDTHLGGYRDTNGKGVRTRFSVTSPDHVARLLFVYMKVQGDELVPMTEKGARFATSDDILGRFKKTTPIIPLILEHRQLSKLTSTYVDVLPLLVDKDDRVHTSFNVTVAATGRLSSSYPNLQNIPVRTDLGKQVRASFIAQLGCVLVSCDLAQIEMVWAAHRSQDETMMEVFHKAQDIHTRTACIVFHRDYDQTMELTKRFEAKTATAEEVKEYKHFKSFQRLPCKTVGFGVLYGQTAEGLQNSLLSDGVVFTLEECQDFIDTKFFMAYPRLKTMLERDYAFARKYAMICDDFGRPRLVPEAKSALKHIASEGIRKAGNHPEQASAQGSIKLAMAELRVIYKVILAKHPGLILRPLLQIHDQLIFECSSWFAAEWASIVKWVMEKATPLLVPVRASSDIGDNWLEL